jgi:hypothetical protein
MNTATKLKNLEAAAARSNLNRCPACHGFMVNVVNADQENAPAPTCERCGTGPRETIVLVRKAVAA